MKLTDFYNEVAAIADTEGTKISAAETKRVLACGFQILVEKCETPEEVLELVQKGMASARKKLQ